MESLEYCPNCGNQLTMAKWQPRNSNIVTKICPQNHLWDIWKQSYKAGFEIQQVSLSKCECGEVMPSRDMKEIDKRKVCPKCFEIAKKAWQMDKEKSYARLEITPVQRANGLIYNLQESIKIEPYPNPFMYGGMWGSSCAKTKEELQQAINSFEATANELRQNGMERVEIITNNEVVLTEQPKLVEAEIARTEQPKVETKPARQFSLLDNPVGEIDDDEEDVGELLQ